MVATAPNQGNMEAMSIEQSQHFYLQPDRAEIERVNDSYRPSADDTTMGFITQAPLTGCANYFSLLTKQCSNGKTMEEDRLNFYDARSRAWTTMAPAQWEAARAAVRRRSVDTQRL
ncbi:hypothetical protein EVAR_34832_1 [Eumeta japonica]|uniref:Uncharacterized protein n=1 Tax=Eumeta variegata TaxID=151549 RepID=A0A4C1YZ84_EUMVA|nr:hypothetical protein EVAR_34832_1 [Eumeta japonica]